MNKWQILPKTGVSLGEIQLTFNDSWEDVEQKLDLNDDSDFLWLSPETVWLTTKDNLRIRFALNPLVFEILFLEEELYYQDVKFIGIELETVIKRLVDKKIKVLFDDGEGNYICPELRIYFFTHELDGGDGTEVKGVGIYSIEWELTPKIYEVTSPVIFD